MLPFENLNKDDEGLFLVDGIVEDLISEFSMIKEVICTCGSGVTACNIIF